MLLRYVCASRLACASSNYCNRVFNCTYPKVLMLIYCIVLLGCIHRHQYLAILQVIVIIVMVSSCVSSFPVLMPARVRRACVSCSELFSLKYDAAL